MNSPSVEERAEALRVLLGCPSLTLERALEALTHKSFGNEHRIASHNERLEFLGDAVLDLAVSHRLMDRYPQASEGELSKLRAVLVNEEALARVSRELKLGKLLQLGRGEELSGGRDKASVLADALEAVLGAAYLTAGFEHTLSLVDRWFHGAFEALHLKGATEDYKSRLQEQAQVRLKKSPRYRVVAETGPGHDKRFEVEVLLGETVLERGVGRSKKEAEQAAAQKTLALLPSLEQNPSLEEES